LSGDGATWHPAEKIFLFPKSALAALTRARFRNAFARLCPGVDLPHRVRQIPWVFHITPWGEGPQAPLGYLARYVFRIAITNNRILAIDDATVTYRHAPMPRCGACCTGSRGAICCVWTRPKGRRGKAIAISRSRLKTPTVGCSTRLPTWLRATRSTASRRFATSRCCATARAHGLPEHYLRYLESVEHARLGHV
jgi:hypothetical protein